MPLKAWYKALPDGHPAKDHAHYNTVTLSLLDAENYGAGTEYLIARHTVKAAAQAAPLALSSGLSAADDISLQSPVILDVPLATANAPAPILADEIEPQIAALLHNWNARSNTSLSTSFSQRIDESRLQTSNAFGDYTLTLPLTEERLLSDDTPLEIDPISAVFMDEDESEYDDLDFINAETIADYQSDDELLDTLDLDGLLVR